MKRLRHFLTLIAIVSTALGLSIGADFLLITYLPIFVAIPLCIGVTALFGYFSVYLIDETK